MTTKILSVVFLCVLCASSTLALPSPTPTPLLLTPDEKQLVENMKRDRAVQFDGRINRVFVIESDWRALPMKQKKIMAELWAKYWADEGRIGNPPWIIVLAASTQKRLAEFNDLDGLKEF
jgi:hypothetical protein